MGCQTREIKNAIIRAVDIGLERGFMVAISIDLDYGGAGQGFAQNYCLYNIHKPYIGLAGHFIAKILQIAGVEMWDQLVGRSIRVDASNDTVYGIGHIIKDNWFYPNKDIALAEIDRKGREREEL